MRFVLDSSALLAFIWSEPGSEVVAGIISHTAISAVNLAEVCTKLADRGMDGQKVKEVLSALAIRTVAFDERQAFMSGELRTATRQYGLSIGDRACLALALSEKATTLTADRVWGELELGIKVQLIR